MEEQNILNGGLAELEEIKTALENQNAIRSEIETCRNECQKLERQILAEEKVLDSIINTTVSRRRSEVEKSFDRELDTEKDKLKGVKSKKDKAKNKGVKDRIQSETSHLVERNRGLHSEIRTAFEQRGIPKFCDSTWFYALYMPSGIRDIIILLITFLTLIFIIPSILTWLIGGKWWLDIIIYVLWLAVVVAVYVTIYLYTKDKDKSILTDMKDKRREVQKNDKEIRHIRRDIKSDKDESMYNLDEYNTQIKDLEEKISAIVVKKNDAIADFEKNTKPAIIEEVTSGNRQKLDDMNNEMDNAKVAMSDSEHKLQELTMVITSKYEGYLGSDMMTLDRINEMIKMVSEGEASTISDAINKIRASMA